MTERRKRQPTPVISPGKFHGQKSLTGYCPWGHKDLDMTELLNTCACIRIFLVLLFACLFLLYDIPFGTMEDWFFFLKICMILLFFSATFFQNTFPFIIMQHYTINEEYNLYNQILKPWNTLRKKKIFCNMVSFVATKYQNWTLPFGPTHTSLLYWT